MYNLVRKLDVVTNIAILAVVALHTICSCCGPSFILPKQKRATLNKPLQDTTSLDSFDSKDDDDGNNLDGGIIQRQLADPTVGPSVIKSGLVIRSVSKRESFSLAKQTTCSGRACGTPVD